MSEETGHQKDFSTLYSDLRRVPWREWTAQDQREFLDDYFRDFPLDLTRPDEAIRCVLLLARVAQETQENEFKSCLSTGEIPPLKLSPQEMQVVSGGWKRLINLLGQYA